MSRKSNTKVQDEDDIVETFPVFSSPIATAYVATVDEEFLSTKQFNDLVHVLDGAKQGDTVTIFLSTPGGRLESILPLLAAMGRTEATTFVHAVSDVASAGTFLLMQADNVYINPYVTIMFHQASFGYGGSGSSVEAYLSHTSNSCKNIIRDMYKHFFTGAEIEAMLSGKDFYMGKEEFDNRYAKRNKARDAEDEEALEDFLLANAEQVKKATKPKKKTKA